MKNFSVILTTLILFSGSLFAAENTTCLSRPGETICSNGNVDKVVANGSVILKDTNVTTFLHMNGSLEAKNAKIKSLLVNGSADMKSSTVSDEVQINGTLDAVNSIFLGTIHLATNSSSLNNCKTKSIIVSATSRRLQKLFISGTEVKGDITFNSGHGEIYLCNKSALSGRVVGGKIIEKC